MIIASLNIRWPIYDAGRLSLVSEKITPQQRKLRPMDPLVVACTAEADLTCQWVCPRARITWPSGSSSAQVDEELEPSTA